MKRTSHIAFIFFGFCYLLIITTGCQRTSDEVWEDTKTAGRYLGKGLRAFAGQQQSDSRQVSSYQDFAGPIEEDFVSLKDEDLYQKLTLGDAGTLQNIDAYSSIHHSRETPGELGSNIPGITGFNTPDQMYVSNIFKRMHFAYNEDKLLGNNNMQAIENISRYMKDNPNVYIFVEGHCDQRGSASYNLALGTRRSNSVRNTLIKAGVDLNNVFTVSYGKERPLAMEDTSEAWSQNRRAEFKIFKKS